MLCSAAMAQEAPRLVPVGPGRFVTFAPVAVIADKPPVVELESGGRTYSARTVAFSSAAIVTVLDDELPPSRVTVTVREGDQRGTPALVDIPRVPLRPSGHITATRSAMVANESSVVVRVRDDRTPRTLVVAVFDANASVDGSAAAQVTTSGGADNKAEVRLVQPADRAIEVGIADVRTFEWTSVRFAPEGAATAEHREEPPFGVSASFGAAAFGGTGLAEDVEFGTQLRLAYTLRDGFYLVGSYLYGTAVRETRTPAAQPVVLRQAVEQPVNARHEHNLHILTFGVGLKGALFRGASAYVEPRLGTILGARVDGNIVGALGAGLSVPVWQNISVTLDAAGMLSNADVSGPDGKAELDWGWFAGSGLLIRF